MDEEVQLYHFVILFLALILFFPLSAVSMVQVFQNTSVIPSVAENKKNSLLFPSKVEKNSTKRKLGRTLFLGHRSEREAFYSGLANIKSIYIFGRGGVS